MRSLMPVAAVLTLAALIGCGGGGGTPNPVLNTGTKLVVGYVYVSTNANPQGSPGTIVTNATIAPSGFAAPTAGSFKLHVDDGLITKQADEMTFDLSLTNAVIARVTSKSTSTPTLSYSAQGIELNGVQKPSIPVQTVPIVGSNDIILPLAYGIPAYTPGAAAGIRVLVADPNGTGFFGAPGDIIPKVMASVHDEDNYLLAVLVTDANGVLLPNATPVVSDPNGNQTEAAVHETPTEIKVRGGGVDGVAVPISAQAAGLSLTFNTFYTYGAPMRSVWTWGGSGETPVALWPDQGDPGALDMKAAIFNARDVPIPNVSLIFTRSDTPTGAGMPNNYPAPAAGRAFEETSGVTGQDGGVQLAFTTPKAAEGNREFNTLKIKGTNHLQIRLAPTDHEDTPVIGSTPIFVARPLGSITISGPSSVYIRSTSPATGNGAFVVSDALDIDKLQVPNTPAVTWNNENALKGEIGNTGHSAPGTNCCEGTDFQANQLVVGPTAGRMHVTATSGAVESNELDVLVFGLPQRIYLEPDTSTTGTFTEDACCWYNAPGPNQVLPGFDVCLLDSGGNDLCCQGAANVTSRTVINTSGTTFIGGSGIPSAPFVIQAGPTDGLFTVQITGTGFDGTPFNLTRVVGVNVAP